MMDKLQELIREAKISNYVLIKLSELLRAYRLGIDVFKKELLDNPTIANKVYEKAEIMLDILPDRLMNDLLQHNK